MLYQKTELVQFFAPEPTLVLGHAGECVAVERVEIVMIRNIMSDNFCIDDVTLVLLAGFVQSLIIRDRMRETENENERDRKREKE